MIGKQINQLCGLIILLFWVGVALGRDTGDTGVTRLSLGRVLPDQPVERVVTFDNPTDVALTIGSVQLTPPLVIPNITPVIEPGARGRFTVTLGEEQDAGPIHGIIIVNFENDAMAPLAYRVEGFVVPPVEFRPRAAFHLVTQRGTAQQASVEIINHQDQPLRLTGVDYESDRYTAVLHTLEPGRYYRLDLMMSGEGVSGQRTDRLRVLNDDEDLPFLELRVNTLLREKVYTFPESVDLGALPLDVAADPEAVSSLAQTLMIYKPGAGDFRISPSTALDNIRLAYERGPDGDRYQVTISLIREKLAVGRVHGSIIIKTNDREFPEITVPVHGEILPAR
jgi:hypothetical protein